MSGTIAEIEFIVRYVLDNIGQGPLVEIPLPFGWTAGRGNSRWPPRLANVTEYALYCRAVCDGCNETHLCPAMGTDQRQYFVDSRQERRPQEAGAMVLP